MSHRPFLIRTVRRSPLPNSAQVPLSPEDDCRQSATISTLFPEDDRLQQRWPMENDKNEQQQQRTGEEEEQFQALPDVPPFPSETSYSQRMEEASGELRPRTIRYLHFYPTA